MQVTVAFDKKLPLVGLNDKKQKTLFDASLDFSGPAKHASPMEVVLESLAACSMMDIITILKKMRKEPVRIEAGLKAERAAEHPRVFTSVQISYRLHSPGCTLEEFEKVIGLSIDKYCSVAAMIRMSGCKLDWTAELI
jgi:putative redox protein